MKRMKKLLSMLVVLGGALGLVACAGGDEVITNPSTEPTAPVEPSVKPNESIKDKYDCISIDRAKEIARENGDEPGENRYYVYGIIKEISNPTYGEMTITDGTDELYVYGTYDADGIYRYPEMEDKPITGDEVVLYTKLGTHSGKEEAKSSWIVDFKHIKQEVDPTEYKTATIKEAREAMAGSKLQVSGVVAAITYANGKKPNGFMLVDNEASIYVYGLIAADVKVGNTLKIAATKTYYVNPDEKDMADKFGYAGACQLADGIILENDNKASDFSTAGIENKAIKDVIDNPVSNDITSKLFVTKAIIKKVQEPGFVNYYLYDLDGNTGSYVYTQCSGSDFKWLDEYDGKIVTLYYTALNCKATGSGCIYRLLPVKVVEEEFSFDKNEAASFISKYYVADQFIATYSADPALELITTVTNDKLGISGTISYSSDNEAIISFATEADKVLMHANSNGQANITATITAEGKTFELKKQITVLPTQQFDTVNVKAAIDAADNEIVTIRGIAGPSLVNQEGFYLIDETGVIAIKCTVADMATIKLGDDIVVRGEKIHKRKEENVGVLAGQSAIINTEILANYYGNNTYSSNTFITGKTLSEVVEIGSDATVDHSTEVYTIEVKVVVEETPYYTKLNLVDPNNESKVLELYCSSAKQYSWLNQFKGKVVTMNVALCNWNDKDFHKGSVLNVISDGVTYNNLFYYAN